jgi:transcriptional regulator CtsR
MQNNWKTAFWTLLFVFIITTGYLVYSIIDQGTTITYMKEGYEDTEYDLKQLASSVKGKLTKSDFSAILKRYPDSAGLKTLELNRIKITFDKDDKVDSIITNW